jgi:uncharacterized damage-inducible protein DinB
MQHRIQETVMGTMHDYFRSYATHAKWANALLYETIDMVDDENYNRVLIPGVRSLHHLLNHVIIMDELWISELRQSGPRHDIVSGDQFLYDSRASMRAARSRADDELIDCIDALDDDLLSRVVAYEDLGLHWPMWLEFAHVFRHQIHHRGQMSAVLCLLGFAPPKLDPMYTPPHLRQTPVLTQLERTGYAAH